MKKFFINNMFLIIAAIAIIIVYGSYMLNFSDQVISKSSGDWGTFGDFIGGTLNPTLAFLSLLAILQTIKIQSKELGNSTRALENSEKELVKSSEALVEQSNSLKIQNFENTFFNMIRLHNEIVNNLKIKNHVIEYSYEIISSTQDVFGEIIIERVKTNFNSIKQFNLNEPIIYGRESIDIIYTTITNFMSNRDNIRENPNIYKIKDINKNRKPTLIYDLCHECYSNIIGHYFGNIYQILKFISTSEIIDKRKYSDLFRAQFSSKELQLLFYHCSASIGSTKFKPLIEEFEFLEHLRIEENDFFKYIFYHNIYKNQAFGLKNNEKIELLKSRIIKDINSEIASAKENEPHKDYKLYRYFSEKDIKNYLEKVKEEKKSLQNSVDRNLILLDYSEYDNSNNYVLKEE